MQKILVVDHDNDMRLMITRFLTKQSFGVCGVDNGQGAIAWMKKNKPDLILCDFMPGDMTGIQLVIKIRAMHPDAVLIVTGAGNATDIADALALGVSEFVAKPLFPDQILMTIKQALVAQETPVTTAMPARSEAPGVCGPELAYNKQYITGVSPEFVEIIRQVNRVAPTDFSVIIYGESGSGKEAIARQIHQGSKRAGKPFVAIDCGALAKELAGSELFGHEKGAFTGALNQKTGCLEVANGGTVFLDEIGNLSYDVQVSLLRVVQERKIRRVGGIKDIELDVRIIVASNVNLPDAVKAGKFREDLFHRFNEFSIELPALRERRPDILLFARHFLDFTNKELGKKVKGFTKEVERTLTNFAWPGNIRELKNVIRRATLLADGEVIDMKSMPAELVAFARQLLEVPAGRKADYNQTNTNMSMKVSYEIMAKSEYTDQHHVIPGVGHKIYI